MSVLEDPEADQLLLEQSRDRAVPRPEHRWAENEAVHARVPTPVRPERPALPPLFNAGVEQRHGFLRRHRLAAALGVPLFLLAGAAGDLYLDYASHFQTMPSWWRQ